MAEYNKEIVLARTAMLTAARWWYTGALAFILIFGVILGGYAFFFRSEVPGATITTTTSTARMP